MQKTNKKRRAAATLTAISLLLFAVFLPGKASARQAEKEIDKQQQYVPGQLIIKFKQGQTPDESFLAKYNLKSEKKILEKQKSANRGKKSIEASGLDRLYLAEAGNSYSLENIASALKTNPAIEYAEPNYIVRIDALPNDPDFSQLWGLNNTGQTGGTPNADINAPEAWNAETGGANVTIGIIDTGIDYNHPDLAANIWTNPGEIPENGIDDDGNGYVDDVHGWDFYNNDNNPFDDNGHGTHVAGTIGAVGNNSKGITGINWTVKMAALKFLSSSGSGTTAGAVSALAYANAMGFKITNNSWGGGGYSQALYDAISAANDQGNLFVAAAGNDGLNNDSNPSYPASYDLSNIISVAATDHNDALASFSNYGANSVDIGAPGVGIYSTIPGNNYGTLNGTSMATPHVSGVAGLIRAHFPSVTTADAKSRLLNGASAIPSLTGKVLSGGRLNAANSLETDDVPPSPINNFAAVNSSFDSVNLEWTAPGDDGANGTASAYDIRYSLFPITEVTWGSAIPAANPPKPQISGSRETFTANGLSYGTAYYFGIKSRDNVGNLSALSNIVSQATPLPAIAFSDNMENGANGWTHSGSGDNWQNGKPSSGPGSARSGISAWATNLSGNYGINYMNAQLISPVVSLENIFSSQLSFWHHYNTENYYDGGIVEISSNGGSSWTQINPAGGYPEDALYPGNPLGAVPAYSGYSGNGWHKANFDLSAYDGNNNVKIRFRFGTDYSVNNYPGWYIDDVEIYGAPTTINNPPVANAGGPYSGLENQPIGFDGSASNDPDGDSLTYKWDFGDGSVLNIASSQPFHTYLLGGNYVVTLIVNDGVLDSNPSTALVSVQEVNDAPIANAGPDQSGIAGNALTFDGSASSDEEGLLASYHWNFGDGNSALGKVVSHSYGLAGNFTVTLTVTDAGGLTAQDTALATISNPGDIITITEANYSLRKKELTVEAKSTKNGIAVLTVQGFGQMTYNSRRGVYQYKKRYVANPGAVTITSSMGGSATKTVTVVR